MILIQDVSKVYRLEAGEFFALKNNNIQIQKGEFVAIMGPSGSGKSSVLRTIAGLWPGASGQLERPASDRLMFLPQRPYMTEGSLRDQLLYPYPDRGLSDADIGEIISRVNLSEVFNRAEGDLDRVVDWSNILSIGEQQRVAFARLFVRRPAFAFLDEATSALDEENQRELYGMVKRSGIGFISVGHRASLVGFHDRVLLLDHSGSWEIKEARAVQPAQFPPDEDAP